MYLAFSGQVHCSFRDDYGGWGFEASQVMSNFFESHLVESALEQLVSLSWQRKLSQLQHQSQQIDAAPLPAIFHIMTRVTSSIVGKESMVPGRVTEKLAT